MTKINDAVVVRLPNDVANEEWCCGCGDDNVAVTLIFRSSGDKITLCQKCHTATKVEENDK